MARFIAPMLTLLVLVFCWPSTVLARGDDEKIIGTWERLTGKDKDALEETWFIKKTKDKWTVSGTFWLRGKNGEVGNFKGKDVKFADGILSFTQDYFKLPKGRENGVKITASAEDDRLDIMLKPKKGDEEKDNMKRAGMPANYWVSGSRRR